MKIVKEQATKETKAQETQKKKRKSLNDAAKAQMWRMKKMGF